MCVYKIFIRNYCGFNLNTMDKEMDKKGGGKKDKEVGQKVTRTRALNIEESKENKENTRKQP